MKSDKLEKIKQISTGIENALKKSHLLVFFGFPSVDEIEGSYDRINGVLNDFPIKVKVLYDEPPLLGHWVVLLSVPELIISVFSGCRTTEEAAALIEKDVYFEIIASGGIKPFDIFPFEKSDIKKGLFPTMQAHTYFAPFNPSGKEIKIIEANA